MENQAERGKQWLEELLALMGVKTTVISEGLEKILADTESCWLGIDNTNLSEQQIKLLIGEKGKNIDAIQYLANIILNIGREPDTQGSYTIELDGYRIKRYQELVTIADNAVEQVRNTGQEAEIPNLSSAERRQIHSLLTNSADLATESRGQEPNRRLVVRLR
ncbi:MAG: R3H domain-containing nucleic acid-binding protein [Xenococcaceae cyanobacterium MO_188.B19]|nr:R3H domain-containing nucleic acid-binding protein [Xenococcaceae cyanobacterium MO_188.B19]